MPLTQLARARWQAYFDRVSGAIAGKRVEVEVTGLGLGDRIDLEWLPLIGLSYDPKSEVLSVIGEGVEHVIRNPKQVHVDHELDWLHGIEVIDAEGNRHIMVLKDPLLLPPS